MGMNFHRRMSLNNDEFSRVLNYSKHRETVRKARSRVDTGPPLMMPGTFLNIKKMKQDHFALKRIMRENISLLVKINKIQRNTGYTVNRNQDKGIRPTNFRASIARLERIKRENFIFGNRLIAVKPVIKSQNNRSQIITKPMAPIQNRAPKELVKGWTRIVRTIDRLEMAKLLRPRVYFDLEIFNIRPVGRITIELFTEACPELVLEFVRAVANNDLEAIKLIRIFPGLWIEGEIYMHNEVLSNPDFPFCMDVIEHDMAGVLSFAYRFTEGFPPGLINYSIAFKPLPVANGRRVPFGIITKGLRFIDCLQDYGTKNGKTKKPIVVVSCGLIE